jgi:hypothetical protein
MLFRVIADSILCRTTATGCMQHVYNYLCYLFRPNSALIASTMAAKDFVEQQLKSHKVIMFSKSYCPYCTTAKVRECV